MQYHSILDLNPDYIKSLIDDVSDAQMNVTLETDFDDKEAVPEIIEAMAHTRQVLKLVHLFITDRSNLQTV